MGTHTGLSPSRQLVSLCDNFMNYSFNILSYIIQLFFIELPWTDCSVMSKYQQTVSTLSRQQSTLIITLMKQNLSGG